MKRGVNRCEDIVLKATYAFIKDHTKKWFFIRLSLKVIILELTTLYWWSKYNHNAVINLNLNLLSKNKIQCTLKTVVRYKGKKNNFENDVVHKQIFITWV